MGSNTRLNQDFGNWELEGIYVDDGCPVNPKCITCPLPFCVLELDIDRRTLEGIYKRARVFPLIQQSESGKHLSELGDMHVVYARSLRATYTKVDGDYAEFLRIYDYPKQATRSE